MLTVMFVICIDTFPQPCFLRYGAPEPTEVVDPPYSLLPAGTSAVILDYGVFFVLGVGAEFRRAKIIRKYQLQLLQHLVEWRRVQVGSLSVVLWR